MPLPSPEYPENVFDGSHPMTAEFQRCWALHPRSETWFRAAEITYMYSNCYHVEVMGNSPVNLNNEVLMEWLLAWAEEKNAHFIRTGQYVVEVWIQKYRPRS